ncbi:DNA topology modulation protein [Paenibacillus sp. CN-4]|uniref:DNA topology modulation protein n=1 Tax=Paenibacillus nanchangensis TaxID=3348343 RepID=UPI00397B8995
MKIVVIGSPGSGKSTFAGTAGGLLHLPVHHLDAFYWKPGWVETPKEEWLEFTKQLVSEDSWIIDGHYGSTLELRMQAADVIVYFDLSPWVTTYRVIKRRIRYHGKTRPDLNEGCPESIDWAFVKYGWRFRQDRRPAILEKIGRLPSDKTVIILRSRAEVRRLLERIRQRGAEGLADSP